MPSTCTDQEPPYLQDLLPFTSGDTWDGILLIGPVTFNEESPPLALAEVRIDFRKAWDDVIPAYTLISGTPDPGQGQITINDEDLWTVTVPPQALPLRPGVWKYSIRFTDASDLVLTPIGGSIRVGKNNTHD